MQLKWLLVGLRVPAVGLGGRRNREPAAGQIMALSVNALIYTYLMALIYDSMNSRHTLSGAVDLTVNYLVKGSFSICCVYNQLSENSISNLYQPVY